MYSAFHSIFRKLPPNWRSRLKSALGADGHGQSVFDRLTARKDATGKKRLDNALESLLSTVGSDAPQLIYGKTCIDFGAGYVPTDGVAMWLLGARVVYGVDYNRIAKPREIARAVRAADFDRVETQLRHHQAGTDWPERLKALQQWASRDDGGFPPGYAYVAPVDVIASPSRLPKFDILVSTSVLEHIPPSRIVAILTAIKSRENDLAKQFHRVDLRDHRDFENDPYGFLDPERKFDAERDADSRGNGMILSDWEELLVDNPEWALVVSEFQSGRPDLFPLAKRAGLLLADWLILRSALKPDRANLTSETNDCDSA